MHRNILLFFVACIYYALVSYSLFAFGAGIIVSSLLLFGLPAYLLARFSAAPAAVLIAVVVFGTGISLVFEGVAHIYGIWYTIGVDEFRLFGLVPIEVVFTSILQILFLTLLYELVFDDGVYSTSSARARFIAFGVFLASAVLLLLTHVYLLKGIYFSHSYLWLLAILVGSTLATLAAQQSLTLRFARRLGCFTAIAFIPLFLSTVIAVENTQKIFAYTNDYLYSFTWFGNTLPLEEILLILVLPLFVATFYELYLDDGQLNTPNT